MLLDALPLAAATSAPEPVALSAAAVPDFVAALARDDLAKSIAEAPKARKLQASITRELAARQQAQVWAALEAEPDATLRVQRRAAFTSITHELAGVTFSTSPQFNKISNEVFLMEARRRLLLPVLDKSLQCVCGAAVDEHADHFESCIGKGKAGAVPRHWRVQHALVAELRAVLPRGDYEVTPDFDLRGLYPAPRGNKFVADLRVRNKLSLADADTLNVFGDLVIPHPCNITNIAPFQNAAGEIRSNMVADKAEAKKATTGTTRRSRPCRRGRCTACRASTHSGRGACGCRSSSRTC
jgi:hypothetical protein